MNASRSGGPPARRLAAATGAVVLAASGLTGLAALPAAAAPAEVDDVTFTWSVSDEVGNSAFFGGCNFLVAGVVGDHGSSGVWNADFGAAHYRASAGDVSIRKPDGAGGWEAPTWQTKCQGPGGVALGGPHTDVVSGNEMVFSGGSGTVDLATGTAEIAWEGSVTVVFYGGMTYWTFNDPVLTVEADGTGSLSGIASGYGADMNDPSIWRELEPREVDFATLSGVQLTEEGLTVTPDYLGVEVDIEPGGPSGEQVRSGDHWGSFPTEFVEFHFETGQGAYWYSSGGQVDPKKPTNPLRVSWELGDPGEPEPPAEPGDGEVEIGVEVPEGDDSGGEEPGGPDPEPELFELALSDTHASLGEATAHENGTFSASGQLPAITVTDTRAATQGWTVTGRASDFAGSGGAGIPATALGWSPAIRSGDLDATAGEEIAPGEVGLDASQVLVEAAAGHGGGSVEVGAGLRLRAPAGTTAGAYTSVLTLSLVG